MATEEITSIFLIPSGVSSSSSSSISGKDVFEVTGIQPPNLQEIKVDTNNKYSFFTMNDDDTIEVFRFYHKATAGMKLPANRMGSIGIFDDYLYIGKVPLSKLQSRNLKLLVSKNDTIFDKFKNIKTIMDSIFEAGQILNVYISTSSGVKPIGTLEVSKIMPMNASYVRNQVHKKLESRGNVSPTADVYVTYTIPTTFTIDNQVLSLNPLKDIEVMEPVMKTSS